MAHALHRNRLATHIALALSSWALLSPGAALAQAAAGAKAPDSGEIQTVNVTANRRLEDQQKVSVSVTAVTGAALAERNVTDLSQFETLSPGFTFSRSGVDARPAIRGVRTENVAVNADTTIGYFVDGIYKSRAQQAMLGFVDVSRVEILRGPQGTLFGRNTFGGSIAITTTEPELKSSEFNASLELGSFGKVRFDGAVNVPLGDTAALRFAGMAEKADPWVKNEFNPAAGLFDKDLKYLRGAFKFKPSRDFDAVLRADVTEQKGNGGSAFGYKLAGTYLHTPSCQQLFNSSFLALNTRGGNRDAVNDCTRTQGAGAGTAANAAGVGIDLGIPLFKPGKLDRINNDYQSYLSLKDNNFSADLTYRVAGLALKSITGYADFTASRSQDTDFSASTIGLDFQKTSAKTLTQEFQVLSEGSGALGYVAGVYFFKDELTGLFINQQLPRTVRSDAVAAPITLAQNGAGFYDLQRPETNSSAIYGQLTFRANDAITLTAGARYTRDKKSFKFANANSVLPLNAAGAPDGTLIALTTPEPGAAAFGTPGSSTCTGSNNQPGFNCLAGTNTVTGATYGDATFSKGTGKLAVDFKLSDSQLLYATVSTGFRSGGFNSAQAIESLRTFKPEGVTAFEVGSKNRFMRNTLQLNLAAFNNDYTNLQEQRQVVVGNTTVSTIFNAAKATAKGLEAELEWRTSRALTMGGSLSLLDAKYTSFPDVALPFGTSVLVTDASATAPQTDANGIVIAPAGQRRIFAPGYSCSVVPGTGGAGQPAALFGCDLSGKRLPYAARYQGAMFARYEFGLAGGGSISPMLVVGFSSGFYGQPTNAEIEKQGSYVKADFKLNWRINDALALQAYVDNFTDKQTTNRFVWGGGGNLQVSAASPRTYGLKLSYSKF
jgi:iron complex outermembrane recepter protein